VARASSLLVILVLLAGCGSGTTGNARPSRPGHKAPRASVPPNLPNPCRDRKGFVRAIKRLEHQPNAEVSPSARRLLRLVAKHGAADCSTSSYTDTIQSK
jgi:hypothetical protein